MRPARGFIALISAIVISTMLLSVAATLDQSMFFARFDSLNGEYHTIASHLSDACINVALLKLRDDYDYTVLTDPEYDSTLGGVPLPLDALYDRPVSCLLEGPTTTPSEAAHTRTFSVTASAVFNDSHTRKTETVTIFNPSYSQGTLPVLTERGRHEVP